MLEWIQFRTNMCVQLFSEQNTYCWNEMVFNFDSKLLSHNRYQRSIFKRVQMIKKPKYHSNMGGLIRLTMMFVWVRTFMVFRTICVNFDLSHSFARSQNVNEIVLKMWRGSNMKKVAKQLSYLLCFILNFWFSVIHPPFRINLRILSLFSSSSI